MIVKLPDGKEARGQELDFQVSREEWNEYTLLDGGRIRFKAVVTRIIQVLDDSGKPVFNQDGTPSLIVYSNNQVVVKT